MILEILSTAEPLLFTFVDILGQTFVLPEVFKFPTVSVVRQLSCLLGVPLGPQFSGSNLGQVYHRHLRLSF